MSLYNQLFGENPSTDRILDMLNLKREDFGRFRDVYLDSIGAVAMVYTRCGGGNREEYDYVYDELRKHPCYIRDYDDEYDSTYSYIEFAIPLKYQEEAKAMATGKKPETIQEKFEKEFKEMEDPNSEASKRAQKIAEQINKAIEENPNGGIIKL